jgi:hypothetical protein
MNVQEGEQIERFRTFQEDIQQSSMKMRCRMPGLGFS